MKIVLGSLYSIDFGKDSRRFSKEFEKWLRFKMEKKFDQEKEMKRKFFI